MSRRALPLAVVVAATPSGGIGKSGSIPWPHLHTDLANFKRLTTTVKFPGACDFEIARRSALPSRTSCLDYGCYRAAKCGCHGPAHVG